MQGHDRDAGGRAVETGPVNMHTLAADARGEVNQ